MNLKSKLPYNTVSDMYHMTDFQTNSNAESSVKEKIYRLNNPYVF